MRILVCVLLVGCGGKDCVATFYAAGMTFCYDFVPASFSSEHAELVVTEVERVSHQYYGFSGLREVLDNHNAWATVTQEDLKIGEKDVAATNTGGFDIVIERPVYCLLTSSLAHELLHTVEVVHFGVRENTHSVPYMFQEYYNAGTKDYELTAEHQIFQALVKIASGYEGCL